MHIPGTQGHAFPKPAQAKQLCVTLEGILSHLWELLICCMGG